MLNFEETMQKETARIKSPEQILGKCLDQPFTTANSGSRKILYSTQKEHALPLLKPEVPIIQTGYENRFGDYSASIIKMEDDYEVLAKISKFSRIPNHHYILIVRNMRTNQLHVITRISYNHLTESYGYLYNNKIMDQLDVGYEVKRGEIVRSSQAYDDYMNRCDGVNLTTAYICRDKTMEDGIQVSESAALKLASPLISKIQIPLNDNDIILNLYGDDNAYLGIPYVGEKVKDGIICAIRRENTDDSLYTQSREMLKKILMSDTKYLASGDVEVIDLDIYSNNPDTLRDRHSNNQLNYYYEDKQRYLYEIIHTVEGLKSKGFTDLSYDLEAIYINAKREFGGAEFIKDKTYSGTTIEITILERNIPQVGDKISNRYGGKGVISQIVPDHLMPIVKDTGKPVEICFNSSTCVNRLNDGQLKETSLTHIGERILQFVNMAYANDTNAALSEIVKFIRMCSPTQGESMAMWITNLSDEDRDIVLQSILDEGSIFLSLLPASESLTLDDLDAIYKEFPYAKQHQMLAPIIDSMGNVRYAIARRPLVCGKMYIYRLKQYAEEKFSVTSLSSVNIRNENTRSKSSKNFKSLHSNTPIKFGDMEQGDLSHIGVENVVSILMIHSVSPQARRLAEQMLTDNPYDIDIKLDDNSINRTAQIANVYLKTMGYRLRFLKKMKKPKRGVLTKGITYHYGDHPLRKGVMYVSEEEKGYDIDKDFKRAQEVEDKKRGVYYEGVSYDE